MLLGTSYEIMLIGALLCVPAMFVNAFYEFVDDDSEYEPTFNTAEQFTITVSGESDEVIYDIQMEPDQVRKKDILLHKYLTSRQRAKVLNNQTES